MTTATTGRAPSAAFDDLRERFTAALQRGDAAAAAEVYAADARLLLPASDPLDGRPAIEAFWRVGLEAGMAAIEFVPQAVNLDTTFASEVGSYVLRADPRDEASVVERGRYLVVHRLGGDGDWRRALEVFAPDREG